MVVRVGEINNKITSKRYFNVSTLSSQQYKNYNEHMRTRGGLLRQVEINECYQFYNDQRYRSIPSLFSSLIPKTEPINSSKRNLF